MVERKDFAVLVGGRDRSLSAHTLWAFFLRKK
jgi:hypothetical protein